MWRMTVWERLRRLDDRVLGPPGRYGLAAPFIVFVIVSSTAKSLGIDDARNADVTSWRLSVLTAVSVACGVAWQVRKRRDLVERLAPLSALILFSIVLGLLPGGSSRANTGGTFALLGVITGLVQAELNLRRRERRNALEPSR